MLFILVILISFIAATIKNKGFKGIENKSIKGFYLIIIGFVIQIVIFNEKFATSALGKFTPVFYIFSLSILSIFLFLNINYIGIKFALCGFLMNTITIISNGGYMPQDLSKLILIGEIKKVQLLKTYGHFYNATIMNDKTHLNVFSDRIVFPFLKSMGSVYSIGDIIIIAGICIFIFEYLAN